MQTLEVKKIPSFSPFGLPLRKEFEFVFSDPRSLNSKRFVWDHWHIKNQYQLLRTPSAEFFNPQNYQKLLNDILVWGQKNLGCHSVSSPWLSCYIEGGFQNFHTDVSQGPWAFVYSLSPRTLKFDGGETLVFKANPNPVGATVYGHEADDLLHRVPPKFNQLVVFDPSLAHGVSRLTNAHDVIDGRLVIHGWFGYPSPFVVGGLERNDKRIKSPLKNALDIFYETFRSIPFHGLSENAYFNFELSVSKSGVVTDVRSLPIHNSLSLSLEREHKVGVSKYLRDLRKLKFSASRASSKVYLPIYI